VRARAEAAKWAPGPKTQCVGAPLSVTQASLRDQLARCATREVACVGVDLG
jgi:hypothetical protein